ncbi:hypothetical protein ACN20G_28355 (plasmid) [Streptomyces sp. BI20]|uniref:hypothetical protein n=1 Tax=Streptomyces sp. BI20 TaxID=3403460 RepID=UPI003C73109F
MNNKIKGLLAVSAGLGVLALGGLLSPDPEVTVVDDSGLHALVDPSDSGWRPEPEGSAEDASYTGPEPDADAVLADFEGALDDAEAGPGTATAGALDVDGCVVGWTGLRAPSGPELTGTLDGLAERDWRVIQRRSNPVAVELVKGAWRLLLTPEPPGGGSVLSLLATHGTPECEERWANR